MLQRLICERSKGVGVTEQPRHEGISCLVQGSGDVGRDADAAAGVGRRPCTCRVAAWACSVSSGIGPAYPPALTSSLIKAWAMEGRPVEGSGAPMTRGSRRPQDSTRGREGTLGITQVGCWAGTAVGGCWGPGKGTKESGVPSSATACRNQSGYCRCCAAQLCLAPICDKDTKEDMFGRKMCSAWKGPRALLWASM